MLPDPIPARLLRTGPARADDTVVLDYDARLVRRKLLTTTGGREHRPGAWWPDQVVDYMLDALEAGSFYILCPDGEVTLEMDAKGRGSTVV